MKIGILGGGQLGRMMVLAGYPLGLSFRVLGDALDCPGGQVAEAVVGALDDPAVLDRFADGLDAVTYEWENVPAVTAAHVARRVPRFFPPPPALEVTQDRLSQKRLFVETGVPTTPFEAVASRDELAQALERVGVPSVLKVRRGAYDGRGQAVLRAAADADAGWERLQGAPAILERFVDFERELSVIAVRARGGDVACYPLMENLHRDGILRVTQAPAPSVDAALQGAAEDAARRLLAAFDYTGVLTVELFQRGGDLLANEMATRVHNTGHWTIEGAATSQFENHLRAGLDLPLGRATALGTSAMVNLIGTVPDRSALLAVPGVRLHLYGKTPAPGRKLGHVTVRAESADALAEPLARVRALVGV